MSASGAMARCTAEEKKSDQMALCGTTANGAEANQSAIPTAPDGLETLVKWK